MTRNSGFNSELLRVFMLLLWKLRFHSQPIKNFYFKAKVYIFLIFTLSNILVQTLQKVYFLIHFAHKKINNLPSKVEFFYGIFFSLQSRQPKMAQTQKFMLEIWPTISLLDYTVQTTPQGTLARTDFLCMLNWGTQWTMVSYLKK